jgi:hypothetical protein
MCKAFVKIEETAGGYLPTMYFPGPDGGDREAYYTSFSVLLYAEEHGRLWAHEHNVEYREFEPHDPEAAQKLTELVKKHKAAGLDIVSAIRAAKAELKDA